MICMPLEGGAGRRPAQPLQPRPRGRGVGRTRHHGSRVDDWGRLPRREHEREPGVPSRGNIRAIHDRRVGVAFVRRRQRRADAHRGHQPRLHDRPQAGALERLPGVDAGRHRRGVTDRNPSHVLSPQVGELSQRTGPVTPCDDCQPVGEQHDTRAGLEQTRVRHEAHLGLVRTDESIDGGALDNLPRQDVGGREVEAHGHAGGPRVLRPQLLERCAEAHGGGHQNRRAFDARTPSAAAPSSRNRDPYDGTGENRATHEVDCMSGDDSAGPLRPGPGRLTPMQLTLPVDVG
jgi:hypothetical protein